MRLINTETFELHDFYDTELPSYAILSHRWGKEEVSYQDFLTGRKVNSEGDVKIRHFCLLTKTQQHIEWAWVDTCCIDKTSSAELTEAINSMYRWYQKAAVCITYLSDVKTENELSDSAWFTRGWTLQELLAPWKVLFYNQDWTFLGARADLSDIISKVTGISREVLVHKKDAVTAKDERRRRKVLRSTCVAEKMSWASMRETSRIEDTAYCLLGLFDVNMPLLYGEGWKAFERLQLEILRTSDDETIFAGRHGYPSKLLASRPDFFPLSMDVRRLNSSDMGGQILAARKPYSITNKGLLIETTLLRLSRLPWTASTYPIDVSLLGIPIYATDGPAGTCSYPLVLPVYQRSGYRGKDRTYIVWGDDLYSMSEDEWDWALQTGGTGYFDDRLAAQPMFEILVSLGDPNIRRLEDDDGSDDEDDYDENDDDDGDSNSDNDDDEDDDDYMRHGSNPDTN